VPLRLIDSSIWIEYLRPQPANRIVRAVHSALTAGEAAVATPIVVELLSGIRDGQEYSAREAELRTLRHIPVDGEAGYVAARIGQALADAGKMGKTVDLMLAGAAIKTGAELWSLQDEHYQDIQALIDHGELRLPVPFRIRWFS
jgi:predicted nucleic acid-binding protein